jgi:MSHA pilin protein MshD
VKAPDLAILSPARRRRALTLVECVICLLIVSLAMVAAMRTMGASAAALQRTGDHATARNLATSLLNEIVAQAYKDPNSTPAFGIETGEVATNRATFDDVDDYNGYTESPPVDLAGTVIPGAPTGWSRSVTVAWVTPTSPDTVSVTETGLKRITVSVKRGTVTLITLTAFKGDLP